MNPRAIIPNTITSCNLLCGCMAVFLASRCLFLYAFCFIIAGAIFDFFDGMTARNLGVSGPLGVQLDSLADDITFGLAPAMLAFTYLLSYIGWWAVIALLIAPFSALRLARFNIDERQHTSFIGLATPANAIFWGSLCSMPHALLGCEWLAWVLLAMTLVSCYLMNAEIPMFSFKMHGSWREHKLEIGYLIGCALILITCIGTAIVYRQWLLILPAGAVCVLWYVVLNLTRHIAHKATH